MKLSELNIGTEYAVVPSWNYHSTSRKSRDPLQIREDDVVKATLISKDKYNYEPSHPKTDSANFTLADSGERSVGVLFKGVDNSGQDVYWTSRLADIIAEWSQLEPRWNSEKQAQAEQERIERERYEKEQRHVEQVKQEVERCRVSVAETVRELIGNSADVSVETNGWRSEMKGVVTLGLKEFQQLVELAVAGRE